VLEWLDDAELLGLALGVASSSPLAWVEGHLERLGIRSRFRSIVCRTHNRPPKPAPDLYLAALDDLGVAASDTIAVEDSPNGITAAKAAGLFCVAVPNPMTRPLDFSGADLLLDSLADLPLSELAQASRLGAAVNVSSRAVRGTGRGAASPGPP
jgi:beta-phosphoglucomutase-like phosphatase (HAD superfamily)